MRRDGDAYGAERDASLAEAVDEVHLARLRAAGEARRHARGDTVVAQGEAADALHLVLRGRFEVRVDGRPVAEIARGELIGEIAFLTGGRRTADVVAARDGETVALSRGAWDDLVARHPDLAQALLAWMARRLGRMTAHLPERAPPPARMLCLLPAAGHAIPPAFAAGLRDALGPGARMRSAADFPAGGGPDALAASLLAEEGRGDLTLLLAERDDAFGRAAVRGTDGVVIVGDLGAPAPPGGLEAYAASLHPPAHRRLVLLRDARMRPVSGSAAWLEGREVALHHHVGLDSPRDLARLARFLRGTARGVVLGGGGALGCAHLGVARALRDAGIDVDFWGGSSIGGALAVALSRGLSPEEVMDRFETIFVANAALGRLTLPRHSLMNHRHFDAQMREHYGTGDLADHPVNVFAASASLTTNDLHVHRRGPAWEAVRASGSLPLVLPPWITADGEVLADGGLVDNLPIATMRGLKGGPNLMVNLNSNREYRLKSGYEGYTTGLAALGGMVLGRRAGDLPTTVKTLLRAMVVSSQRKLADTELGDDVLLRPPPVRGMSITDWKNGRRQEAQAHAYAAREIADGRLAQLFGPSSAPG